VALGANARRYVEQAARLDDAAYDYYRFICQVLNRTPEIEPAPVVPEAREVIKTSQSGLPALVYQAHVTDPQDSLPPGWDELAQAAAEIGLDENDPVLEEVTRAARFAGL
jgi:hypothetical protein